MADWGALLDGLNGATVAAFGREAVWLPQTGTQATIRGILETAREPDESSPGVYAVLFVRLADLGRAPVRGDAVLIDGVAYTVFDIEADASGGVVLRLRHS